MADKKPLLDKVHNQNPPPFPVEQHSSTSSSYKPPTHTEQPSSSNSVSSSTPSSLMADKPLLDNQNPPPRSEYEFSPPPPSSKYEFSPSPSTTSVERVQQRPYVPGVGLVPKVPSNELSKLAKEAAEEDRIAEEAAAAEEKEAADEAKRLVAAREATVQGKKSQTCWSLVQSLFQGAKNVADENSNAAMVAAANSNASTVAAGNSTVLNAATDNQAGGNASSFSDAERSQRMKKMSEGHFGYNDLPSQPPPAYHQNQ